jgi:hypothetical protein
MRVPFLLGPAVGQADRRTKGIGPSARAAAAPRITAAGVGVLKLGMTFPEARERGLVGKLRAGCPLGGPGTRSAQLLAPLEGSADLRPKSPYRVRSISVRGGAKARGIGIGARIRKIRAAFPKAKVDHSTDETFGVTLVRVPKGGGGGLQFAVSTKTKRATLIGVPFIPFCE